MIFHKNIPYTFAGQENDIEKSRVVILPVPYDATTTYKAGTREGPHAIITASRQLEDYDEEFGMEVAKTIGVYTSEELEIDSNSPLGTSERVEDAVISIMNLKKIPVVLGGEHSITYGVVRAMEKFYGKNFSILQIDAHADLRYDYMNSLYNHACVMRRIREMNIGIVQVGIRSYCKEEAEFIKKAKIKKYIHGAKFNIKEIMKQLKNNVYVTVDVDGLDPAYMPAVGTPEPGGIEWEDILKLFRELGRRKKVIGFDVVELSPIPGNIVGEYTAARLIHKMMGYFWLK